MALQQQVYTDAAIGVPGAKAVPDQAVYTAVNYFAGEGVKAGNFCFASAADGNVAEGSGEVVLGLVERVISATLYSIVDEGGLDIPEYEELAIADKGDFYVIAGEAATAGGKVYAEKSSGAIMASAGTAVEGVYPNVETGWKFAQNAAAGEIVIIYNH